MLQIIQFNETFTLLIQIKKEIKKQKSLIMFYLGELARFCTC